MKGLSGRIQGHCLLVLGYSVISFPKKEVGLTQSHVDGRLLLRGSPGLQIGGQHLRQLPLSFMDRGHPNLSQDLGFIFLQRLCEDRLCHVPTALS